MRLPERFVNEMRTLLGDEFRAFMASYDQPKQTGLRVNGLKLSGAEYAEAFMENAADPIRWADGGFYTEEDDRPGKQPHYFLGLYYIQEPSAMAPAGLLDVKPGHRVLDLCAAPGGKSTQLAAKLQGQGLLLTNDNAAERTKALAKNIERAGVRNAVVTNEEPARLADAFGAFFDRVLVDAPCSGEGMFRKDESLIRAWERSGPEHYAAMQRDILLAAARLVAPGGKLLYSTCTFSPRENEGTIARFLAAHPDFEIVPIAAPEAWGWAPGRPKWLAPDEEEGLSAERTASLAGTARLWPHRCRGEGHFAALLARAGGGPAAGESRDGGALAGEQAAPPAEGSLAPRPRETWRSSAKTERQTRAEGKLSSRREKGRTETANAEGEALEKFAVFAKEALVHWNPRGRLVANGEYVYIQPDELPVLMHLHVVRRGWLLGAATKHRFEPSQALAMGLAAKDAAMTLLLASGEELALRYLKGETLHPSADRIAGPDGKPAAGKGWVLVCVDGYPAGWGRWDGQLLKNALLPGWRWM